MSPWCIPNRLFKLMTSANHFYDAENHQLFCIRRRAYYAAEYRNYFMFRFNTGNPL